MTWSVFSVFSQEYFLFLKKLSISWNSTIRHWHYSPDWMDNNEPEISGDRKLMMSPIWSRWPIICSICRDPGSVCDTWGRAGAGTSWCLAPGETIMWWPQGTGGQTSDTASDPRYCPIWSGDTIASPVSVSTFLTINPFTKLYCPDNHLYTPESVSQSWQLSDPWQK